MSTDPPDQLAWPPQPYSVLPPEPHEDVAWTANYPPPRPKFQHRYQTHLLFFALTFFTTTFRVAFEYWPDVAFAWWKTGVLANPFAIFTWPIFLEGLSYSVPLLIILGAHEFGHYFACRYYDVDATLPYFIPAPQPFTGTFGAVIRIREAFPSKQALFDIGIAGPIAGFVALLPFLLWGMHLSTVVTSTAGGLYFGEPLLMKLAEWAFFGVLHIGIVPPGGLDVALHPMGFAAWFGMLATALNLLPFGQLDGGHIMYAAVGRRATLLSVGTLAVVLLLTALTSSWFMTAILMVGMAIFFGFRHPRIVDEDEPLDPTRRLVAICAVIIFILCFTPVPIEITGQ